MSSIPATLAPLRLLRRNADGLRPIVHVSMLQLGPDGALLIGEANEVTEKIIRHSETLGGISRITFQMNASSLPHAKLMKAIEAIGTRVAPALRVTR